MGKVILCPLYEAGCLTDPNNFRDISLTDILNKKSYWNGA